MVCFVLSLKDTHPKITANHNPELSIAPDKNHRLVPAHARKELQSRGIDLDNFSPLSKDEMVARLD